MVRELYNWGVFVEVVRESFDVVLFVGGESGDEW